jgi:hypothetical protein
LMCVALKKPLEQHAGISLFVENENGCHAVPSLSKGSSSCCQLNGV